MLYMLLRSKTSPHLHTSPSWAFHLTWDQTSGLMCVPRHFGVWSAIIKLSRLMFLLPKVQPHLSWCLHGSSSQCLPYKLCYNLMHRLSSFNFWSALYYSLNVSSHSRKIACGKSIFTQKMKFSTALVFKFPDPRCGMGAAILDLPHLSCLVETKWGWRSNLMFSWCLQKKIILCGLICEKNRSKNTPMKNITHSSAGMYTTINHFAV